jgi:hypothetical protein
MMPSLGSYQFLKRPCQEAGVRNFGAGDSRVAQYTITPAGAR